MLHFRPLRVTRCAALGAIATLLAAPAGAQAPAVAASQPNRSGVHATPPRSLEAQRVTSAIVVDGVLGEEAWAGIAPATDFTQSLPDEGKPATLRTEVRFAYDDEALYIGARMFDPLGVRGVKSTLTRRDRSNEGESDMLTITFDPFHDHLSRVVFEMNPASVRGDAFGPGGVNTDYSWDPVWELVSSIDSLGWVAEARIPFSQLRYPRETVQTWGVQVIRFAHRINERSHYAFWTRQEAGGPSRFNHLEGLRITSRPARLELLPYMAGRSRHLGDEPGNPYAKDGVQDLRVGADLKYLLTSNLTLDATLNPDFGQVEADPAVVNLSQYENSFPERRPFFISGSGIFSYGGFNCFFCSNVSSLSMFYSRRVGRAPQGFVAQEHYYEDRPENATILGAGKITGRTSNGWTIGVLDAVTRRERAYALDSVEVDGETVPREFREEVEPLSNYFVGRVKKDMRQGRLVVGGIATSTVRSTSNETLEARLPKHAEGLGADVDWWIRGRRYRFMGAAAVTNVAGDERALLRLQRSSARYFHRPDRESAEDDGLFSDRLDSSATRLTGYGSQFRLSKEEGSWLWESHLHVRSPGFENNDIALLTRTDFVYQNANVFKRWTKPTTWYREAGWIAGAQQQFNFDGDLTDRQYHTFGEMEWLNNWYANVFFIRRPSTFDDRLTRGGPVVRKSGNYNVSGYAQTDQRKRVNFSTNPSYGWSEAGTTGWYMNLYATYRPSSRLTLTAGPDYGKSASPYQYVYSVADPALTEFFGRRYVFGVLDQRTVSMSTRLNVTFTPTLTLEMVATPFVASGRISKFQEFDERRQEKRSVYGRDRGTISDAGEGWERTWTVDPDGDPATANGFSFSNADIANTIGFPAEFNTRSLIGNAVLRWEYRPGSTLYAVWSHNRDSFAPVGGLVLDRDRRALFGAQPRNVFLVKMNYWLAI